MSIQRETQDGASFAVQRNDLPQQRVYQVNEKQFENWQFRWNSKEEVIEHLLCELEKSMTQSSSKEEITLNLVSQNLDNY